MKYILLLAASVTIISACGTKKKEAELEKAKIEKSMIETGFVKADIKHFKDAEAPCDFLLVLENGDKLEPMKLSVDYQSDGTQVWIKYDLQRRPSNCPGSMPVSLVEVKKR
jgi:hypothetical protein